MAAKQPVVRVICNADFRRRIAAFRSSGLLIKTNTMRNLVETSALSAQKLAKVNLRERVYTAALPPSAIRSYGEANAEMYLEHRRMGKAFDAVVIDPPYEIPDGWVGTVKVSKSVANLEGYYYALILNFGGRKINYPARPFWTDMRNVMLMRYRALGVATLRAIKDDIETGAASGSLGMMDA